MVLTAIRKYSSIYKTMFKYSIIQSTTYRTNFIIEILVELGYQGILIAFFTILYANIKDIAGWTYYEVLFLIGHNIIASELYLGFSHVYNLRQLPTKIKDGQIDFSLLRPISSLFTLTVATPYFSSFIASIAGFYLIYKSILGLEISISPLNILVGTITTIAGLLIAYSIATILTSFAFKFTNGERLPQIANGIIFGYSQNPHQIYQGVLKPIFYFFIPVIFISSIPVTFFIRQIDWFYVFLSIFLATLFLYITKKVWDIMIKNYSSASS
jgi:ABC-2 type transport system permease protein